MTENKSLRLRAKEFPDGPVEPSRGSGVISRNAGSNDASAVPWNTWWKCSYALVGLVLLGGCSTATQRQMRQADAALVRSREMSVIPDWNAALMAARETGDHVRRGIEARPIRSGAGGRKVDLRPLLAGFENGPIRQLETALQSRTAGAAAAAYPAIQSQCIACHLAMGKTQIKISPLVRLETP